MSKCNGDRLREIKVLMDKCNGDRLRDILVLDQLIIALLIINFY